MQLQFPREGKEGRSYWWIIALFQTCSLVYMYPIFWTVILMSFFNERRGKTDSALASPLGSHGFKSRPRDRVTWLRYFVIFFTTPISAVIVPQIRTKSVLPTSFPIHHSLSILPFDVIYSKWLIASTPKMHTIRQNRTLVAQVCNLCVTILYFALADCFGCRRTFVVRFLSLQSV
jgi:hypothetical protein